MAERMASKQLKSRFIAATAAEVVGARTHERLLHLRSESLKPASRAFPIESRLP
jgi:hypothetical protein